MDVIGNNIANVNTVGFKVSRTTFQSMLNQTVVGAKSPESGGRGGTNAMQIGLGSQLGSIGKIMTQGSFQNTGKKTDLGLQGDGFFVLSDGLQDFYSRAGNFELDENGNFIQPATGLKLQGWISKIDPKTGVRYLDLDKPPRDLFIQAGMTMPAKATSNAYIGGNLNSKVGIEPLTITVKNPDDPTKNYKVRFSFEKLPPYDTKRLFSSSTIKYTWHAELVDWNAESPSELPELNYKTGMVELNQFGQIEKFLRYPEADLDGNRTLAFEPTTDPTAGAVATGTDVLVYTIPVSSPVLTDSESNPQEGIQLEYTLTGGAAGPTTDYQLTTTAGTATIDLSASAGSNIKPAAGDEVIVQYAKTQTISGAAAQTGTYSLNSTVLFYNGADITHIESDDFTVEIDYGGTPPNQTYTSNFTTTPDFFEYDKANGTIKLIEDELDAAKSNIASITVTYRTETVFVGDGSEQSFTVDEDPDAIDATSITAKIRISNNNLVFDGTDIKFNEKYTTTPLVQAKYQLIYRNIVQFNDEVINGDSSKTWFNYSPDDTTSDIAKTVKELFDYNDDGILDKIITGVSYHPDLATECGFSPALTQQGKVTTFSFTGADTIKPADGDLVNVVYYTQEDLSYIENKTQYNISGPILNSQGTDSITGEDIVVKSVNSSGLTIDTFVADTDFNYDNNTGTITFLSSFPADTNKIRVEYCTKDSFTGDGTKTNWDLSKPAIEKPAGFTEAISTAGENAEVSIDLNNTINSLEKRLEFKTTYPDDTDAQRSRYRIKYANPENPQQFDTISILVADTAKAQVSIPKTGDIKFFDKNDTQNYVIGDYESPKYTTSSRFYDSLGNAYTVFFEYQKIAENQWAWRATEESGISISYLDDREREYTPNPNDLTSIVGGVVEFDSAGRVSDLKAISQNGKIQDINISRIKFDPGKFIDDGAAPPPSEGATAVNASIDFSELVQFNSEFSASITSQDGNSMGVLQNYAINPAGEVVGTFSNGKSDVLGQIALAIFNNPSGLTEMGNTLFQISANSGIAQVGLPGSGGRGTVSPGVLEMSNVDLAEEFTGMVIVQRAFQANARTVTTVDQILQELVNLKR